MAELLDNVNLEESDGIPYKGDAAASVSQAVQEVTPANDNGDHVGDCRNTRLNIPFSVYTARNGYDWTSIPDGIDRDVLDYYYKKSVEHKPDFMTVGDVVKGVAAYGGYLAAFRIQVVKHWDEFGRNADYCAFAFIDYENAKFIDFEALLELTEFVEPRRDPPSFVQYSGDFSKTINSEDSISSIKQLYAGAQLKDFDFAKIGALISEHGAKCSDWLFCKVVSAVENGITVSTGMWNADPYPLPEPPQDPPPPPPSPTSPQTDESPSSHPIMPTVESQPSGTVDELEVSRSGETDGSVGTEADRSEEVIVGRPLPSIGTYHSMGPSTIYSQHAYRTPAQRKVHKSVDDVPDLTPEQRISFNRQLGAMAQENAEANDKWFNNWLVLLLAGVCAILVFVLLWLVFSMFFFKGSIDFGVPMGKEQPELNTDELGTREIKSLDGAKADLDLKKGGK